MELRRRMAGCSVWRAIMDLPNSSFVRRNRAAAEPEIDAFSGGPLSEPTHPGLFGGADDRQSRRGFARRLPDVQLGIDRLQPPHDIVAAIRAVTLPLGVHRF